MSRVNANEHSQTGNWKKRQVKFEDKPKNKSNDKRPQILVYTPSRIKHLSTQASTRLTVHKLSGQVVHKLSGQAAHKLSGHVAVNPTSAGSHGMW